MNKDIKRHLISAGVTFLTGFALAILPVIDEITLGAIKDGTIVGFLFAAVRGGIKLLLENFISKKA